MAEEGGAPAEGGEGNPGTSDAGTISESAGHWTDPFSDKTGLDNYSNLDEYQKTFNEAQSMIGRSVRIPTSDAGAEDMDKFYAQLNTVPGVAKLPGEGNVEEQAVFYNKLGRPEEPGGYKFTEVADFEGDKKIDGAFAARAHELGLSQRQADGVYQHLAGNVVTMDAEAKANADAEMNVLRKNWGPAFDTKILEAQDTVLHVERSQLIPNLAERLQSTGLEHNPLMMEVMDVLRQHMTEEQIEDTGVYSGVMTPADAEARIQEIRNARSADPGHILNHEEHPGYEAERKRYDQLYNIARG